MDKVRLDKIRQNKIKKTLSAAENLNKDNDVSPLLDTQPEEPATSERNKPLDNLLWFDAQMLASSSPDIADINNAIEISERSENHNLA